MSNRTKTIRLHESTYELISKEAQSLADTYDSVVLRLLSASRNKKIE